MKSNGTDTAETSTTAIGTPATNTPTMNAPEQLSLLSTPSVPLQFRLDERTRRSGLQHVAELHAMMVAQAASRRTAGGRSAQRSNREQHNPVAA